MDEPKEAKNLVDLPATVLSEIFYRCDVPSIQNLQAVCRSFNSFLSCQGFYVTYCERLGITLPPMAWRKFIASQANPNCQFDYRTIALHNPYRANLCPPLLDSLTKMCEEYGWTFVGGGNGFEFVEGDDAGQQFGIQLALGTSYEWGTRIMHFDLVQLGVEEWILDRIRPRIIVEEWVSGTDGYESIYQFDVQLLRPGKRFQGTVDYPWFHCVTQRFEEGEDFGWRKVCVVVEDYPSGLRSLSVRSAGMDLISRTQYHGPRFANTTIRVEFPDEPRLLPFDSTMPPCMERFDPIFDYQTTIRAYTDSESYISQIDSWEEDFDDDEVNVEMDDDLPYEVDEEDEVDVDEYLDKSFYVYNGNAHKESTLDELCLPHDDTQEEVDVDSYLEKRLRHEIDVKEEENLDAYFDKLRLYEGGAQRILAPGEGHRPNDDTQEEVDVDEYLEQLALRKEKEKCLDAPHLDVLRLLEDQEEADVDSYLDDLLQRESDGEEKLDLEDFLPFHDEEQEELETEALEDKLYPSNVDEVDVDA